MRVQKNQCSSNGHPIRLCRPPKNGTSQMAEFRHFRWNRVAWVSGIKHTCGSIKGYGAPQSASGSLGSPACAASFYSQLVIFVRKTNAGSGHSPSPQIFHTQQLTIREDSLN